MRFMPKKEIKKILLLRNDKIGDLVISSNVFRALRKNFPGAKITLIASNSNKALVEKNKNIDEIITLDYPPRRIKDILDYLKLSKKIKEEKFDVGIDLRGSIINSFLLFYLPRVKYKVGFYNRLFGKFLLDYPYKKNRTNMHSVVNRIDLINKALGLKVKNYWPEIATDKEDEKTVAEFIRKNKLGKFIVIVPDASLEKKQWSLKKFDEIIKFMGKRYPKYNIVLAGANKGKIDWLINKNPNCISSINKNLRIVYLLFKKSSLVIAHDGGPMHLAWASRANLIALFSKYLNLNYLRPLGRNSKSIVSPTDSTDSIKAEEVKKEIDGLLKKDGIKN